MLSAVSPEHMLAALRNVARTMRPGGRLLFRDFAEGDLSEGKRQKVRRGALVRGVVVCGGRVWAHVQRRGAQGVPEWQKGRTQQLAWRSSADAAAPLCATRLHPAAAPTRLVDSPG